MGSEEREKDRVGKGDVRNMSFCSLEEFNCFVPLTVVGERR